MTLASCTLRSDVPTGIHPDVTGEVGEGTRPWLVASGCPRGTAHVPGVNASVVIVTSDVGDVDVGIEVEHPDVGGAPTKRVHLLLDAGLTQLHDELRLIFT